MSRNLIPSLDVAHTADELSLSDGTRRGHLATIFCTMNKFAYDQISYTREHIRVPDGGTIAVDFTPVITPEEPIDDRPILVVCQ